MSSDEIPQDAAKVDVEEPRPPTEPAAMAAGNKKRPRLDLDALTGGGRERKRGKSMFGLLVGTLNKAKIEDKERNASEAAKKRQLIEQRLQNKLRKETDSVRRAEEAKKDKMTANRKEEELQLKDSIYKHRRTRLPLLSNFLITSDNIPSDESTPPPPSSNPLTLPPRSHPPPLHYLPAILTPAQEAFLARRKVEVAEAAEKEWDLFREERESGIAEINQLRQRVADEEARRKTEKSKEPDEMDTDHAPAPPPTAPEETKVAEISTTSTAEPDAEGAASMDVDKGATSEEQKEPVAEPEKKEEPAPMQADDDDAVEY
ncbi:hypothetical protein D9615_008927 [Tricholomella constricta]|uniref:Pinin/SDK/MemA protein domain-containing protein n=1 Tax=Tricholomella constricta TaxID=117010 RepID=A0A8H5H144_9AGAR|nr:hypothetical protein D9615_008927 [Tricholomella constricta]